MTRIKSKKLYNELSSFSNDLMKRKTYRASRGRGKTIFRRVGTYGRGGGG